MKKFFLVALVTVCTVFASGCGSEKKLNCSKDFSSTMPSGVKLNQETEIIFKGKKIDQLDMSMQFEIPESYKNNMDTFVNTMKTTYENQYGKYEAVKVEIEEVSDLKFNVNIKMDYDALNDSEKKALGASNGSESYSANKKSLEDAGYTCK